MTELESICPRYHRAVELVGARWNGAIVLALMRGARRYADVRAAIPSVSDTMLAGRLKTLEAEGVIERRVLDATPVRVEYRLTAKGESLRPVVEALRDWAHEWIPLADEPGADAA